MGYEFEVLEFNPTQGYVQRWSGESFIKAMWNALLLKREGVLCIQILWRPKVERGKEKY